MRKRILILIVLFSSVIAMAVLVLTRNYPSRFEQHGDALVIEEASREHSIRQIAIAPDNSVWAATSQGIAHFKEGQWRFFTSNDGLADNDATSIYVASDGTVWIGTINGVSHFANDTWHNYTQAHGLPDNKVTSIIVGPDEKVWLSTCAQPVYSDGSDCLGAFGWFDGYTWQVVNVPTTVPGDRVFPPRWLDLVDPQGRPWLNTGLYGLAYLNNDAWVRVSGLALQSKYAPDNSRWALLMGSRFYAGRREWETVFDTTVAVCRWKPNGESDCYAIAPLFDKSYPLRGKIQDMVSIGEANLAATPSALAGRRLSALAIAPDGAVWVATDKNVVCFDGQNWYNYDITQGKRINQMKITSDGSIWAITSQTKFQSADFDPNRIVIKSVERLHQSEFDVRCRWIGP